MLRKLVTRICAILCVVAVLLLGIYLGMSYYYSQGFPAFTWINSVYCTGKSIEEVNRELLLEAKAPILTIMDAQGNSYELNLKKIGYRSDYTEPLALYMEGSNDASLFEKVRLGGRLTIEPAISFQEELLHESFFDMEFVKKEMADEGQVTIVKEDGIYVLHNTLHQRLNWNQAYDYIAKCLREGMTVVDLQQGECYEELLPTEKQKETLNTWEKLNSFLDCGVVYDMGDAMYAVDKSVTSSFVLTDEEGVFIYDINGNFMVDDAGIAAFVASLAMEYDTVDTELEFQSTRGDIVSVPYKKYGTQIDQKKECAYLKQAFLEKRVENHVPAYKKEGYVRGKNDIGFTYIEIDMSEQVLYVYEEGELTLQTDIVTGNEKRNWSTPAGVNYVYAKQKNRILRGADYASFVHFWMPVNGGIGIHDATWRGEFGGEIYKTNGSHGCINVPKKNMIEIYDRIEVGTPVVMFY